MQLDLVAAILVLEEFCQGLLLFFRETVAELVIHRTREFLGVERLIPVRVKLVEELVRHLQRLAISLPFHHRLQGLQDVLDASLKLALLLQVAELIVQLLDIQTLALVFVQLIEYAVNFEIGQVTDELLANLAEVRLADAITLDNLFDDGLDAHVRGAVKNALHSLDDLAGVDRGKRAHELLIRDGTIAVLVQLFEQCSYFFVLQIEMQGLHLRVELTFREALVRIRVDHVE